MRRCGSRGELVASEPFALGLPLMLAVVVVLAACASQEAVTSEAGPPLRVSDVVGSWVLQSGRSAGAEVEPVDDYPITLVATEDKIGGSAGCNTYGSAFDVENGGFRLGDMERTVADCGLEPVMDSEAQYLEALGAVTTVRRVEDELVLIGPGTELRFGPSEVVDERAFVDRRWRLVEINVGGTVGAPEAPAMLTMDSDGRVAGTTGCRTLSGTWAVFGGQVLFPDFTASGECPAELAEQDRIVIEVLGDGFRVRLLDGRLVAESQGVASLTFVPDSDG